MRILSIWALHAPQECPSFTSVYFMSRSSRSNSCFISLVSGILSLIVPTLIKISNSAFSVFLTNSKISFSLYLIHFPLFKLFGYLHRSIFDEKPANFLISLFYLLPVIFLAWLFFMWVEDPIHQWSKKKRYQS